ncbi:MAG: phosphate ABC transporter permease subunit PstC [Candidatus Omnitrophica bacterium]|nr:phosphate ABC transporter permease subunit PstC [Candidatus Omnitrophota bacterium]
MRWRQAREWVIEQLIRASGISSIVMVVLIFAFLLKEGLAVFQTVPLGDFLAGQRWYPISEPPRFGILPLLCGSALVTGGAALLSVPLSIASALCISEIAKGWAKEALKTGIELFAAIPSVVLGFIGVTVLAPLIRQAFHLPTGLTALTGSITLAFMAMPTIVSITEDALSAVPRGYREAAVALGATRWQMMTRVLLPAAASGIVAAVMLGVGRVIGETMAVMMLTGNAAVIPHSLLQPVRTLTATIAAEMGETVRGSDHYSALFAIGIVLFAISFSINLVADLFLHRTRAR